MRATSSILAILLVACGGKQGGQQDADVDQPLDAYDSTGDSSNDPPADADGASDIVEDDTQVDDPSDTTIDAPMDMPDDAVDGHDDDETAEPDAAGDADSDNPDAIEDLPVDTCPDVPLDLVDVDGSLPSPYILSSEKGTEYPTGTFCNPDGSFTEELEVVSLCSGCIRVYHYCAWMNCCTTLSSSLTWAPPFDLEIIETETDPYCFCEGYFSPRYDVCGLGPGGWTVSITELDGGVTVP